MVFQSPILRAKVPSNIPSDIPTYKSPYGPKYHYQPHIAGLTPKQATRLAMNLGTFGGVALFGVIYFASGIPRVQRDILQKLPVIGPHFIHEIPASDNPF